MKKGICTEQALLESFGVGALSFTPYLVTDNHGKICKEYAREW